MYDCELNLTFFAVDYKENDSYWVEDSDDENPELDLDDYMYHRCGQKLPDFDDTGINAGEDNDNVDDMFDDEEDGVNLISYMHPLLFEKSRSGKPSNFFIVVLSHFNLISVLYLYAIRSVHINLALSCGVCEIYIFRDRYIYLSLNIRDRER